MQPDGTCGLSYSKFHVHEIVSSTPAAVQAARPEEMDSPPAEAHVPDCTIWYEYTSGGGGDTVPDPHSNPDPGSGGGGGSWNDGTNESNSAGANGTDHGMVTITIISFGDPDPCPGDSVEAAGYCWAISNGSHSGTCDALGLEKTSTEVNVGWDAELMETVATKLGYTSVGKTFC